MTVDRYHVTVTNHDGASLEPENAPEYEPYALGLPPYTYSQIYDCTPYHVTQSWAGRAMSMIRAITVQTWPEADA